MLLSKADLVVRKLLPALFEASGRNHEAILLRALPEFKSHFEILYACGLLDKISKENRDIGYAASFCEKAIWSAVAADPRSFRYNIDHAHAAMAEGLNIAPGSLN